MTETTPNNLPLKKTHPCASHAIRMGAYNACGGHGHTRTVASCSRFFRLAVKAAASSGLARADRGDYDEAARQYQRSLDINERLGKPGRHGH